MTKKKNSGIRVFKTYRFMDKDPVIDEMRTLVQREKVSYKELDERGAAKAGTYTNWFTGNTRRPQFATIRATARALGHDYVLVKKEKKT